MNHINNKTVKILYPSVDFSSSAVDAIIKAHGGPDAINFMLKFWQTARNVGISHCLPLIASNKCRPLYNWAEGLLSCYDGSSQSKSNIVSAIELFGATIGAQAGIPFKMESRIS